MVLPRFWVRETWYRTWYRPERTSPHFSGWERPLKADPVAKRTSLGRPPKPVRSGNPRSTRFDCGAAASHSAYDAFRRLCFPIAFHKRGNMADPVASATEKPAVSSRSLSGRYWARTSDPQLVESRPLPLGSAGCRGKGSPAMIRPSPRHWGGTHASAFVRNLVACTPLAALAQPGCMTAGAAASTHLGVGLVSASCIS
jgi:hypothetical protein